MEATAIRERPIIFSSAMVRAIIDGRKTQTRRVIKPQPTSLGNDCWKIGGEAFVTSESLKDHLFHEVYGSRGTPYGSLYEDGGDRLWVRETWMPLWDAGDGTPTCLIPTGHQNKPDFIKYRADGEKPDNFGATWKPAIHMPRWASRLTLEITDVRVERLTSISSADCIAEGLAPTMRNETPAKDRFRELWDSINGNRPGCDWKANPWVWAISFRKLTPGKDV